jgi:hypothetical protein
MSMGAGIAIGFGSGFGAGMGSGIAIGTANGRKQERERIEKGMRNFFDGRRLTIQDGSGRSVALDEILAQAAEDECDPPRRTFFLLLAAVLGVAVLALIAYLAFT